MNDLHAEIHVRTATACTSAGTLINATIARETTEGQVALRMVGERAVARDPEAGGCAEFFDPNGMCIVGEPFEALLTGDSAREIIEGFASLPPGGCTASADVQCEMPCDAVTFAFDAGEPESSFCCGQSEDPDFTPLAEDLAWTLMLRVDEAL